MEGPRSPRTSVSEISDVATDKDRRAMEVTRSCESLTNPGSHVVCKARQSGSNKCDKYGI